MSNEAFHKIACLHCWENIEFAESAAGQTIACPHCQGEVMLDVIGATTADAIESETRTTPANTPTTKHKQSRQKPIQISNANPIPVEAPGSAVALEIIGWIQIVIGIFAGVLTLTGAVNGSWIGVGAILITGVTTLGLSRIVHSTHETARRLARMELFFQSAAKERR